MNVAGYMIAFTVLCGIGSFCLGRLTVRANGIQSLALKAFSYLGIAVLGMGMTIAPVIFLWFSFSDGLESLDVAYEPGALIQFLLSASYLLYYAVLYLSFRMGTGRVHGHG